MSSAEPRYYDALTAEARCLAGEFVVYGIRLAPFSLRHAALLEQLESTAFIGGSVTPHILLAAAVLCSTASGTAPLPPAEDAAALIAAHDFSEQFAAWESYLATCHATPHTRQGSGGGGRTLHAPCELIVVTYLMRHTNETAERLWTMPAGLAYWYFEAIREQESGHSALMSEAEMMACATGPTPEEAAASAAACRRMEALEKERVTRLKRCKTDRGRRRVMAWFIDKLRTFDATP